MKLDHLTLQSAKMNKKITLCVQSEKPQDLNPSVSILTHKYCCKSPSLCYQLDLKKTTSALESCCVCMWSNVFAGDQHQIVTRLLLPKCPHSPLRPCR